VLNLVGAGLAIASGHADTIGYQCPVPPAVAIVFFFWMLLIAGLVEGSSFGAISRRSVSRCWGEARDSGSALASFWRACCSPFPTFRGWLSLGPPVDWGPSRTWGFWRSMVSSSASSTSGRTTFGCLFSFTRPAICPEQLAFSFLRLLAGQPGQLLAIKSPISVSQPGWSSRTVAGHLAVIGCRYGRSEPPKVR